MKTAVEWLYVQINERISRRNPHDTIIIQTQGEVLTELFEKALEMEKQQIIDAVKSTDYIIGATNKESEEFAQQYYNKTYKSE